MTAATLCAPLVAALGLVGFAVAGGGSQPEMGTLTGAQGLPGTTVAATNPAPTQVSEPTAGIAKGFGKDGAAAPVSPDEIPAAAGTRQGPSAPPTSAPSHKPPTQTAPKPQPSPRVRPPAPTPSPTVDPSGPGAPITTGGTGTSGSSSGASSGPGSPDGRDGDSGGD